jgi:hypothetical protein
MDWESVSTHWTGWGKMQGKSHICRLTMSFSYVLERLSDYWDSLIIRESEEDGLPLEGSYAELHFLCWPSLETMLNAHPLLLSRLIMEDLQCDFAGYVLRPPSATDCSNPCYFLASLSAINIIDECVEVTGEAWLFAASRPI